MERHYTTVTVYWMLHITITTEPGKLPDGKQMQERDALKDEGKWIVSKEDAFVFVSEFLHSSHGLMLVPTYFSMA